MQRKQLYLSVTLILAFITRVPSAWINHDRSKDSTYPMTPLYPFGTYPVYAPPYIYYPPPFTYPAMLYHPPGPVAPQHWNPAQPQNNPVTIIEDSTRTSLLEYPTKESNNLLAQLLSELTKSQIKTKSLDGRPISVAAKENGPEGPVPIGLGFTKRLPIVEIPTCQPQDCTVAETLLFYTDPSTYCLTDILQHLVYYPSQQELDTTQQMIIDKLIETCEDKNMKPIRPHAGGTTNVRQIYEDILQNRERKAIACAPREVVVQFPVEGDIIYKPECYNTTVCSGCCTDNIHQCLPTLTRRIKKMVHVFKKKPVGAIPGIELEYSKMKQIEVDEHVECKIQCKVKKCNTGQTYDPRKCECRCKERKNCRSGKRWNEKKCRCECTEELPCSTGRKFSNSSCRCEQRN